MTYGHPILWHLTRRVWLVDAGCKQPCSPAANVDRSDSIGVAGETAPYTGERALSTAIAFVHTTACGNGTSWGTGTKMDKTIITASLDWLCLTEMDKLVGKLSHGGAYHANYLSHNKGT